MNYQKLERAINNLANTPPETLFIWMGSLLVLGFALYFYKQRREMKRLSSQQASVKLQALSRLLSVQQEEMVVLRERLGTLEAYVDRLSNRQQRYAENAHQRKQRVDDAIAIAVRGFDDSDLASRAGVSPSEAKLIANLYSQNSAN